LETHRKDVKNLLYRLQKTTDNEYDVRTEVHIREKNINKIALGGDANTARWL